MTPAQVAHIMSMVEEYAVLREHGSAAQYDAAGRAVEAALRDAPQTEPTERTGNPEVDRVLDRLDSSDPDFDDCAAAAALIYKLEIANRGPEGFATWKEAVMHERKLRLAATPSAPTAVEPAQRWPVSQDPLTQLQVAAIISDRDTPTGEQSSVVEPRDERAEFEAWAGPITALAKENGKYVEVMTSLAWEAWQARASKGTP